MATITADATSGENESICMMYFNNHFLLYVPPPPFLRKKLDLSSSLVSFTVQVDQNLALYLRL